MTRGPATSKGRATRERILQAAAELVIEKVGGCLSLLMTDVNLAGRMTGVELAYVAKECNPALDVVVTSGRPLPRPLPDGAKFWPKPWAALDVLREARMAQTMTNEASR